MNHHHQCHSQGISCSFTSSWKLLVVCISISIAATSSIDLVQEFNNNNNSTLISPLSGSNKNVTTAPPARVLACGSRLKLEIRSICTSHHRESNNNNNNKQGGHVRGYYSPGFPAILKHRRKERNDADPERRSEGNLLRKIVTRVPRGVIEECCRKPCDRQSLLKYCSRVQETKQVPLKESSSSTSTQFQSIETSENLGLNGGDTDKNQSAILPLLLQLLWDWESWEKPYSANMMNFHPQKLLKIVKNRSHKLNCSRGRGISARDIKSNSNAFPRSRHSLTSDETRRDSQVSDENNDEFVFPMEHNNMSPLETLAITVTDEPLSQVFPISAGTNVNDYTG